MSYQPYSEKTPVAPMPMGKPAGKQDYRENGDIRRTRLILIILLAIDLVISLFYFIQRIVALAQFYQLPREIRETHSSGTFIGNVITGALSLLYVIIFLVVVIKYIRLGILIFAWLGLIQLIIILIFVILGIIGIVTASIVLHAAGAGFALSIVVIVVAGIACLITILLVIFAFKLAKLLKMHDTYQLV